MGRTAKNRIEKPKIVHWIKEYQKRRKKFIEKYGRDSPFARERILNFDRKINNYYQMVRRIDMRYDVSMLKSTTEEFFNVSLENSWDSIDPSVQLAVNIFYKHGLEIGLKGPELASITGELRKYRVSRIRLHFVRSFNKHPEYRTVWNNFLLYIKIKKDES